MTMNKHVAHLTHQFHPWPSPPRTPWDCRWCFPSLQSRCRSSAGSIHGARGHGSGRGTAGDLGWHWEMKSMGGSQPWTQKSPSKMISSARRTSIWRRRFFGRPRGWNQNADAVLFGIGIGVLAHRAPGLVYTATSYLQPFKSLSKPEHVHWAVGCLKNCACCTSRLLCLTTFALEHSSQKAVFSRRNLRCSVTFYVHWNQQVMYIYTYIHTYIHYITLHYIHTYICVHITW